MNSQNLDDTKPLRATANSSPMLQQTSPCLQIRRSSDKPSRLSSGHILPDPKNKSPSSESRTFMSYYSENGGLLYRSYSSGHLRKISIFCDELVVPSASIPMLLHACCDYAMSDGHLAYRHTFDKAQDRFWWPTLHHNVKTWCLDCRACQ